MLGADALFHSWWAELLAVIIAALVCGRIYVSYVFSHWNQRGIASYPGSFPFGSIGDFILQRKAISEVMADIYKKGVGNKLIGYYSFLSPSLLVRDPELIRLVLVKDFQYFMDRGTYCNEEDDPLSAHIFSLDGERWRKMRTKLSPSYTSGKMKFMFDTMRSCGVKLQEFLTDSSNTHKSEFESKTLMSKYGINVIARTAIGMDGNNYIDKDLLSEMTFKVTDPEDIVQTFRFAMPFINRNLAAFLKLRFTPKVTSDYYMEAVQQIIEHREKNDIIRNDFLHLLLEMKKSDREGGAKGLTLEEIAAQTFLFILAGHETTSSAITFCLHELVQNHHIQQKLQDEIDSTGYSINDITFENIQNLKYMEAVLQETLRKYPPAGVILRECIKDYKCPDGFVIKKGTRLNIALFGLQRDPQYFPNPEKFDPERFNKNSPSQEIVPFSYLPFGEGPRFCIGKRFAMFSIKLGIFAILSKFRVESIDEPGSNIVFNPALFLNSPKNGLNIRFVPRI